VCPRVLLIEKYKRAKADHTTNEVAISLGNGEPCFRIKPRDLAKEPKKQQRKGKYIMQDALRAVLCIIVPVNGAVRIRKRQQETDHND
jgi:hypothetical protein